MTFNTIRAFSIRPGDKMPRPLSWGGWDKTSTVEVAAIHNSAGMVVFTMKTGETVRAFPMNTVPFLGRT